MEMNKDILDYYKKNKKDNRWNKIKKKYVSTTNNINVTTDTVKKFLDINYIDKNNLKVLNGTNSNTYFDPVKVMNLRHQMIRNKTEFQTTEDKLPIQSYDFKRAQQIESIDHHNQLMEKFAINSEISKFQNEIKIQRSKKTMETQNVIIKNKVLIKNFVRFDFLTDNHDSNLEIVPNEELIHISSKSISINEIIEYNASVNDDEVNSNFEDEIFESSSSSSSAESQLTSPDSLTVTSDEQLTARKIVSPKKETLILQQNEDVPLCGTPKIIIRPIGTERPYFMITNKMDIHEKENTEKDKIITELFNETIRNVNKEYERELLRKSFQKWVVVINLAKISGQSLVTKESRMKKINDFLMKIRQEKNQIKDISKESIDVTTKHNKVDPIILTRTYRHKLKLQSEMIEIQKLKLERQEQIITELKLSKMFDESKHSKFEMKTELNNFIQNGTVRLRAKAKCLQVNGNLKTEDEDESNKLQAKGNEAPRFLAKMEARQIERALRHAEAKEKRLRLEKEKEETKIAVEEAKRLEDEKVKHERYEALREKRRQEKLLKLQRERDRLRYIENCRKANEFYRIKLLKDYGINQFKKIILIKKRNEKKSKLFSRRMLLNNYFRVWNIHTQKIWEKKKTIADEFYKNILIKGALVKWKKLYLIAQSKFLVAVDLFELRLCEKCINLWSAVTKQSQQLLFIKMRQAESHYNWHLKWKSIEKWQRLHAILKIEKETEERRLRWRIKIWELLPDYQPNKTENYESEN